MRWPDVASRWSSLVPGRASKSVSDTLLVGKGRLRAREGAGAEGACSGKLLLPSETSAPALCSSRCARSSLLCILQSTKRGAASEAINAAAKNKYTRSSSRHVAATTCSSTMRASVSETFRSSGRMIVPAAAPRGALHVGLSVHGTSAHPLYAQSLFVEQEYACASPIKHVVARHTRMATANPMSGIN